MKKVVLVLNPLFVEIKIWSKYIVKLYLTVWGQANKYGSCKVWVGSRLTLVKIYKAEPVSRKNR